MFTYTPSVERTTTNVQTRKRISSPFSTNVLSTTDASNTVNGHRITITIHEKAGDSRSRPVHVLTSKPIPCTPKQAMNHRGLLTIVSKALYLGIGTTIAEDISDEEKSALFDAYIASADYVPAANTITAIPAFRYSRTDYPAVHIPPANAAHINTFFAHVEDAMEWSDSPQDLADSLEYFERTSSTLPATDTPGLSAADVQASFSASNL